MSPNTAARMAEMNKLDALAKRERRVGGTVKSAGLTEAVLAGSHEAPIPENAPPHIRAALEKLKAMTPEERAAGLATLFPPAPEPIRGRFTISTPKDTK